MKPVIVLVGRPNVGKSTLFNRLTGARDAIVADIPGVTRDRQYGEGKFESFPFYVVDTGGVTEQVSQKRSAIQSIEDHLREQTRIAIGEADAIIFVVDAREGLIPADRELADDLRQLDKPVALAINKAEGIGTAAAKSDFYSLGISDVYTISAVRGDGVGDLVRSVLGNFELSFEDVEAEAEPDNVPRVSFVGRPNAGKSTLINAILGEERVVVSAEPGTTRDSISVPLTYRQRDYILIDTAGVRRKSKVRESLEKFSVIKTLQAIEKANVVVLVIDGSEGLGEQDATLAGFILEQGRALVIAVNKTDLMDKERIEWMKREVERRFPFLSFAATHFISAKQRSGIGTIFGSVDRAYQSAWKTLPTSRLNRELQLAVERTAPPMVRGRRIKLKFAHQGGKNPPRVIVHGNQVESVPESYRRYLANSFRKAFRLEGTPVVIEFRQGENPYQGRPTKKSKARKYGNSPAKRK